ncbi:hypothetical protein [Microbacterium sp. LWS13-1.2]|uniref:Nucleotidyltransferase family protein n=1 Tax=Microbacterium sp. LWS13-1.2 TaxID=3135264 RepID=A0AAU6SFT9_9MICO
MVPPLDAATGLLPLGRHHVTLDAVRARYVDDPEFAASTTRQEIWDDFEDATTVFRRIVPTAYVWIAGSFVTNKLDPDDLDLIYWCEDRLVDAVSHPGDKLTLQMFATNRVRPTTGYRLDTRYGRWHVDPAAGYGSTPEHQQYAYVRGYWDDFWHRRRSGAKADPPVREDALPRAGYLEVMLDGVNVI